MGTSEKVPIFAWIVREGGLPVPLHRSPLQDQLGLQGFVYSLTGRCFRTVLFVFLEARLSHAGDLALVRQLTEADTADAVVAQVSMGTAADLAAIVRTGGELRLALLLEDHRFLSHVIILLSSQRERP